MFSPPFRCGLEIALQPQIWARIRGTELVRAEQVPEIAPATLHDWLHAEITPPFKRTPKIENKTNKNFDALIESDCIPAVAILWCWFHTGSSNNSRFSVKWAILLF